MDRIVKCRTCGEGELRLDLDGMLACDRCGIAFDPFDV